MSEKYTWDWTRKLGKKFARVVVYCGEDVMLRLKMENPEDIQPLVDDANRGAAAEQPAPASSTLEVLDRLREQVMDENVLTRGDAERRGVDRTKQIIVALIDEARREAGR